jgi:hypothetical protein
MATLQELKAKSATTLTTKATPDEMALNKINKLKEGKISFIAPENGATLKCTVYRAPTVQSTVSDNGKIIPTKQLMEFETVNDEGVICRVIDAPRIKTVLAMRDAGTITDSQAANSIFTTSSILREDAVAVGSEALVRCTYEEVDAKNGKVTVLRLAVLSLTAPKTTVAAAQDISIYL